MSVIIHFEKIYETSGVFDTNRRSASQEFRANVLSGISFIIVSLFFFMPFIGLVENVGANNSKLENDGFKGVSYRNVVPGEKVTVIQYDPNGLLDDYSYLCSVPASVFYSPSNDKIVGHPVLFTQDHIQLSGRNDPKLALDAEQGVDYLMEDLTTVATNGLDVLQTVNVNKSKVTELVKGWNATSAKILSINRNNPYDVAYEIASTNWEYSDNAVVAVIKDSYEFKEKTFKGEVKGTTPSDPVINGQFKGNKYPTPVNPNEHKFTVENNYKYIQAKMTWGSDMSPVKEVFQRGKDPDLQLYCGKIGEVAVSENWNVLTGASEKIGSYLYYPGEWWFAVTYMPTKSIETDIDSLQESDASSRDVLQEDLPPILSTVRYTIDYSIYPGADVIVPQNTPYACRNASFELSWNDSSQTLGLIVCGPSGAEIATSLAPGSQSQVVNISQLGEGTYKVAVVNLNDDSKQTDFTVKYSWKQVRDDSEADCIASATNGAVLASMLNAPLLFAKTETIPDVTLKALDLLGVKNVYLIRLNDVGSSSLKTNIENHRIFFQDDITVTEYKEYREMYFAIQQNAKVGGHNQTDIVFSCVDPYSYWSAAEDGKNPQGEEPGGRFFGPAALIAAFHGCPVFLTESHPILSCAQAWHNEFWLKAYVGRLPPSVACMVLEGKGVYKFLDDMGFDQTGQETIITVADQFDIGTAWDRALVGPATPGRIQGTPTDCSVWVSRSIFYPDLIFANPAVSPELDTTDGKRIQGSYSTRTAGALRITKAEEEEDMKLPVLESWVSYTHKFNELASEYWGCDYVTAMGITPYKTSSGNQIDLNGNWPDISTSEMVPYYFDKCGYDQVYSTSFDPIMENLNRGVVLWFEIMHGGNSQGGIMGFWDPANKESNPWRGYEENLLTLRGATDDPDVVSMSKQIGYDIIPTNKNPLGIDALERHDGVIIALAQQEQTVLITGFDMNEKMQNLHSVGFSAGSCLIACSYLHTAMVRHGCVFQVIDPWLTSWYSSFAMECFVRDLAIGGYTVGQMYERGIKQVGIEYLLNGWWWDIFENVVFYGDPDIMIYTPNNTWAKPLHLEANTSVDGHNIFGALSHPHAIFPNIVLIVFVLSLLTVGTVAAAVIIRRRRLRK